MTNRPVAVLLSLGARPFFLLAAAWAVFAIGIWPVVLAGDVSLPGAFAPIDWHAHELIFGYGGAVVAGFLLTSIANWTGRPPVAGARLGLLLLAWIAGRASVAFVGPSQALMVGALIAGLLFPLGLMVVAAVEILAAGNTRNRIVIGILGLLLAADAGFTLAVWRGWDTAVAQRGGLAVLVLLILLIGGRVTPAFTRNWLKRRGIAANVVEFDRLDRAGMLLSAAGLVCWVAWPDALASAPVLLLSGLFGLWRLTRWHGWAARRDALMAVLHLGYLLAVIGFIAAAAHAAWPDRVPMAAVVHLWAVGAVGMMTTAMMTRATLGHTGQALQADRMIVAIYLALLAALAARLGMAIWPQFTPALLPATAAIWCAAFLLFLARFGPALSGWR